MHYVAFFYRQKSACALVGETKLTVAHGETSVVAIVIWLRGWQRSIDGEMIEASDAPQLIDHSFPFELKLCGIVDVLPAAATTLSEYRTGWLHSSFGRRDYLDNPAALVIAFALSKLDDYFLAWQTVTSEDDLIINSGDAVAAVSYVC
jgi:hypothetical protein